MQTTRRGFFGLLAGVAAGPALTQSMGPAATLPTAAIKPVEYGLSFEVEPFQWTLPEHEELAERIIEGGR